MDTNTITQLLDALGQRFGATGAHLWGIMIRQSYIVAAECFVWTLVLMICTGFLVRRYRRPVPPPESMYDTSDSDEKIFVFIGAIVCVIVALGVATVGIDNAFNPEHAAILRLLSAMK